MKKRMGLRMRAVKTHRRRAAVLVWAAVSLTLMIGFAALAIDIGHMYLVKVQMQSAADSGAMAGVSALAGSAVTLTDEQISEMCSEATNRAMGYASKNQADRQYLCANPSDVDVGHLDSWTNLDEQICEGGTPYNAVRVSLYKGENAPNDPIPLSFARIWGKHSAEMSVTATAYMNNQAAYYRPVKNTIGALIPVTIRLGKYNEEIMEQGGQDNFGWDPDNGGIQTCGDTVCEVSIYPEKQKKAGNQTEGAGNFGILNINCNNVGSSTVRDQITGGLTGEDLMNEFGTDMVSLWSDPGPCGSEVDGSPIGFDGSAGGNPGLMASLEKAFEARLGQVAGFFIHEEVCQNGSNATYKIVGVQFGRLMKVRLTGGPTNQCIIIQPAPYLGMEIVTDEDAPPHLTAGRIMLVR